MMAQQQLSSTHSQSAGDIMEGLPNSGGDMIRHEPSQRNRLEFTSSCGLIREAWEERPVMTHHSTCYVHMCNPALPHTLPKSFVSSVLNRLPSLPTRHILHCGHEVLSLNPACNANCSKLARKYCLDPTPMACPSCKTIDYTTLHWRALLYARETLAKYRQIHQNYHDTPQLLTRLGQLMFDQQEFLRNLRDSRISAILYRVYFEQDMPKAWESVCEYCTEVIGGWIVPHRDIEPATGLPLPKELRELARFLGMSPADEDGNLAYRWETSPLGPDETEETFVPQDWVAFRTVPDSAFPDITGMIMDAHSEGLTATSLEAVSRAASSDSQATVTQEGYSQGLIHRPDNQHRYLLPVTAAVRVRGRSDILHKPGALPRVLAIIAAKLQGMPGQVFRGLIRNVPERKNRAEHFIGMILEPAIAEATAEMSAEEAARAEREDTDYEEIWEDQLLEETRQEAIELFRDVRTETGGYVGRTIYGRSIPQTEQQWNLLDLDELRSLMRLLPDGRSLPLQIKNIFDFLVFFRYRDETFQIPGRSPWPRTALYLVFELERMWSVRLFDWTVHQADQLRQIVDPVHPFFIRLAAEQDMEDT